MSINQFFPANEFYQNVNPAPLQEGQFCWIITPHLDVIPRILDVTRNDPTGHTEVKFELRNANGENDFRAKGERTLPIKYLGLRTNEELLTQKAKKRPAIILSTRSFDLYPELSALLKRSAEKHHQEDFLFMLPCYSAERWHPIMVTRIKCMLFRQFFYLPPCPEVPTRKIRTKETIVRLDRIQVLIGRDPSTIEPTDLCLSSKILSLLKSQFVFCVSGETEDEFGVIRALVTETYSEGDKQKTHNPSTPPKARYRPFLEARGVCLSHILYATTIKSAICCSHCLFLTRLRAAFIFSAMLTSPECSSLFTGFSPILSRMAIKA